MSDLNSRIIREALKNKRAPPKFRRTVFPKSIERSYAADLKQIVEEISKQIKDTLLPLLPSLEKEIGLPLIKKDEKVDDIVKATEEIKKKLHRKYTNEELKAIARKKGMSLSKFTDEATKKEFKRVVGVDLFTNDKPFQATIDFFSVNNIQLSNSLIDQSVDKAQSMVFNGFQTGKRWEEIAKDIEQYIDPDVGGIANRAKLIARDQIAKLNSQVTQERQKNLGISKYIWRTSLDERVRDSHRELEGTVHSWDDPPSVGHPGEDIQCRCTAEPVLDEFFEE